MPRSEACWRRSTAASSSPARAARRPAAAWTCCRPGAISSRSTAAPCRRAAAWHLGWKSAALLVERYVQEHGDWPRAVALSAWGTANMRTGGDDIAQALALIGARPVWDAASHRVTGIEILPRGPARPPARRRHAARLRLLPRRLPGADRAVRPRRARGRGAGRAGRSVNPIAARVRADAAALRGARRRRRRARCGARATACSAPSPALMAPACRR